MSPIDLPRLLQPVSDDEPAGPDLEYDPTYLAAFRAAEGSPSRQMGDTVVAGEEPDWRATCDLAADLLTRTKDLRVAVLLDPRPPAGPGPPRARLGLDPDPGAGGAVLGAGLPPPRPRGRQRPHRSASTSCWTSAPANHLLHALRSTPLVRSRVLGPLSYRDIEIAEGRASAPPDAKPLDCAAIHGVFMDCDIEELQASAAAAAGALEAGQWPVRRPRRAHPPGPDAKLRPVVRTPGRHRPLAQHLSGGAPAPSIRDGAPEGDCARIGAGIDRTAEPGAPLGEIASRDDVVRAIDRICDYYSRYEPSSPVPLLLQRARRLATGSFVDIVRDLAPDALGEIEKVCG